MKPHVYIFRGAPASGKGTIVPAFSTSLPKPVALIEQDTFRWGFHLIGRSVEQITPEEHRMAYENMLYMYERYLLSGKYTIVIEGLFSWGDELSSEGSAKQLIELAARHGFDATSIVLTADRKVLLERNSNRPSYTTPQKEFIDLYNGVYGEIDEHEVVIDSTTQSPADTIAQLQPLISISSQQ